MKILFLTEYFYPFTHGGSEWSIYYLAKSLTKEGYQISILTPNFGTVSQEKKNGLLIYRMPFPIKFKNQKAKAISPFWFTNILFQLWAIIWIIRLVKKLKIDIIHVQGNYFLPASFIAGKILKRLVIATVRDYQIICPYGFCLKPERDYKKCNLYEFFYQDFRFYLKNYCLNYIFPQKIILYLLAVRAFLVKILLSFVLRRVDKIICISKKQEKIFNLNGFKNTMVIYNSFEKPAVYGKVKTGDFIFFAGRLTPGKGINLLLKSFVNVCKIYPKLRLLIAGEGFLKKGIKNFIKNNNLEGKIELLGQISYIRTLFYLKKSLVCVVPSVWEEPFGRVALEAQFLGIPVVATNRGGLPEIIVDKRTGYVVEPNEKSLKDGIIKVLKNNLLLRKNIKKKSDFFLKKFQKDIVDLHINLYRSL